MYRFWLLLVRKPGCEVSGRPARPAQLRAGCTRCHHHRVDDTLGNFRLQMWFPGWQVKQRQLAVAQRRKGQSAMPPKKPALPLAVTARTSWQGYTQNLPCTPCEQLRALCSGHTGALFSKVRLLRNCLCLRHRCMIVPANMFLSHSSNCHVRCLFQSHRACRVQCFARCLLLCAATVAP